MKNDDGGRCPHGCSRCRQIEAGLAGRALTQSELILVGGGLVEQSREGRVVWSEEVIEARLAKDVADIAFEDASRDLGEVHRRARIEADRVRHEEPDKRYAREAEIEAALNAAQADFEDAKERRAEVSRRLTRLEQRESEAHRVASAIESQAAAVAASQSVKQSKGRGAIARIRERVA